MQDFHTKINYGCRAVLEYQKIKCEHYFDIANILNYDIILGTPFLFQHKVSLSFNFIVVVVGLLQALPLEGKRIWILQSYAADVLRDQLQAARTELQKYAAPICKEANDSPLPLLHAINHSIHLIDESKVYSWCLSKCLKS